MGSHLVFALALFASPAAAQGSPALLATVPGQVRDLSVDAAGRLLFCTQGGLVGRIDPASGAVTTLATTADGLPTGLRAVVETPSGDVAVLHAGGDVHLLAGGVAPPLRIYADLYMIAEASDLIADAAGNLVICSKTPTSGKRGINWIDATGSRWAYFLVEHSPLSLAVDPLSEDLVLAELSGGGRLWTVSSSDETRPSAPLDTTSAFGFDLLESDGDLALDAAGNVYVVAGGEVWRHDRASGTSAPFATGFAQLRGAAIAASSPGVASATGWSLYVAEDEAPARIVELPGVEAPAPLLAPDLGRVPDRGQHRLSFAGTGLQVFELAVDEDGSLLVGGAQFGNHEEVRRIDPATFAWSVVADENSGLNGRVEGIASARDGTIYTLSSAGFLHAIPPGGAATPLFTDPLDQVTIGKDLLLDADGTLFVADREGFGPGEVLAFSPATGLATSLVATAETRGLAADPRTAGLLVTQWHCIGFCGTIDRYDFGSGLLLPVPGLATMNYSNDSWGDGDSVVDVEGNVYTCSEDDWRVVRYDPAKQRFAAIGSMYLNHPSGVAIAASSPGSGSATGWSLYVSEFDHLWEIPGVPPPAARRLDRGAPPVGELVGWLPRGVGTPRAMIADPAGDGLLVSTSAGTVERLALSGERSTVAAPGGDLTGLAARSSGMLVVATADGLVLEVDPAGGATSVLFADPGDQLLDVRGITVDGLDRVLLQDRDPGSAAGRLHRLEGGALQLLARTSRGLRPAVDPLTADVFVTERGAPGGGGGEVLRVDASVTPPRHGHWRGDAFTTFRMDERDGGIAFAADGSFYLTEGELGRVVRVDRASGARSVVAGNHEQPLALALAPGRPGIAGPQGTSLFVLDGWAVHELGVPGLPAPPPPASPPGLAPPADLAVHGEVALATLVPLSIDSPPHAGRLYVILPTLSGKLPGLPLKPLGGPRFLPSNPDLLWNAIGNPVLMPASIAFLDASGKSPAGAGIFIGPDPSVLQLGTFVDLVWVALDPSAPSRVAMVGGTAQLFLGP